MYTFHFVLLFFFVFVLPSGVIKNDDDSYIIGWSSRYIVAQHMDGVICHLVQGSVNFRPKLFIRVTGLVANA